MKKIKRIKRQWEIFWKEMLEDEDVFQLIEEGLVQGELVDVECGTNYDPVPVSCSIGTGQLTYGYTRFCLVPDEGEWVYKFTYRDLDYCGIEVDLYKAARKANVEDFFAETFFLGDYFFSPCDEMADCAIKVYVMRKVDELLGTFEDDYEIKDNNSYNRMREVADSKSYGIWETQLGYMSDNHDEGDIVRFLNFCENKQIEDLHSNNIGILDGKVKLIDYCGI